MTRQPGKRIRIESRSAWETEGKLLTGTWGETSAWWWGGKRPLTGGGWDEEKAGLVAVKPRRSYMLEKAWNHYKCQSKNYVEQLFKRNTGAWFLWEDFWPDRSGLYRQALGKGPGAQWRGSFIKKNSTAPRAALKKCKNSEVVIFVLSSPTLIYYSRIWYSGRSHRSGWIVYGWPAPVQQGLRKDRTGCR